MPKTCENCICWRKIGSTPIARRITYDTGVVVIPPGDEGQCRLGAPIEDFKWPLTKGGDWCAGHRTTATPFDDALARLEADLDCETALMKMHKRKVDAAAGELDQRQAERSAEYKQDEAGDGLRTGTAAGDTLTAGCDVAASRLAGNGGPAAAVDAATPQGTAPQTRTPAPAGAARAPEPAGNRAGASRSSPRSSTKRP